MLSVRDGNRTNGEYQLMTALLSRKPTKREIDMVVEAAFNALPEGVYAHQSAAQFVSLVAFAEQFTPLSNLSEVAPAAYRHNVEQALMMGNIGATGRSRPAFEAARMALKELLEGFAE